MDSSISTIAPKWQHWPSGLHWRRLNRISMNMDLPLPYTCAPINVVMNEIRLLTLHPGAQLSMTRLQSASKPYHLQTTIFLSLKHEWFDHLCVVQEIQRGCPNPGWCDFKCSRMLGMGRSWIGSETRGLR